MLIKEIKEQRELDPPSDSESESESDYDSDFINDDSGALPCRKPALNGALRPR